MNKRQLGTLKEDMAVAFLRKNGVTVLEKNYRFHKAGEIDIIGLDNEYLVFFEVKYRKTASAGHAAEAVTYSKIKQICKISDSYRIINHIPNNKCIRFDVIAIDGDELTWYKNAFSYAL